MPRTFLAIDLPAAVQQALREACPRKADGVRPVLEGQLHLTLHFLGDVASDRLPPLLDAVQAISFEPFDLTIAGVGRFPPRGRATVLWAGLTASEPLHRLHRHISSALQEAGFRIERRQYTPHITLARLSSHAAAGFVDTFLSSAADLSLPPFTVTGFVAYESQKTPHGSQHLPLLRVSAAAARRD